jgi:hypothetical protein
MATASEGTTSQRAASRARSSNGKSRGSSARTSDRGRQTAKKSSGSSASSNRPASRSPSRGQSATSRSGAAKRTAGKAAGQTQQSTASSNGAGTREALTNVGIGIAGATVGVVGGVLLGRTALRRGRSFFGVPVPEKIDIDLGGMSKQIGEAGRQFGRLASEVRAVQEKAEQLGRALT